MVTFPIFGNLSDLWLLFSYSITFLIFRYLSDLWILLWFTCSDTLVHFWFCLFYLFEDCFSFNFSDLLSSFWLYHCLYRRSLWSQELLFLYVYPCCLITPCDGLVFGYSSNITVLICGYISDFAFIFYFWAQNL